MQRRHLLPPERASSLADREARATAARGQWLPLPGEVELIDKEGGAAITDFQPALREGRRAPGRAGSRSLPRRGANSAASRALVRWSLTATGRRFDWAGVPPWTGIKWATTDFNVVCASGARTIVLGPAPGTPLVKPPGSSRRRVALEERPLGQRSPPAVFRVARGPLSAAVRRLRLGCSTRVSRC
jgi:hypothetical protein